MNKYEINSQYQENLIPWSNESSLIFECVKQFLISIICVNISGNFQHKITLTQNRMKNFSDKSDIIIKWRAGRCHVS